MINNISNVNTNLNENYKPPNYSAKNFIFEETSEKSNEKICLNSNTNIWDLSFQANYLLKNSEALQKYTSLMVSKLY